jgi:hypothetical protein
MNISGIKWLEWSYPVVLWIMVAFFSLLACRNVVASVATPVIDPIESLPLHEKLIVASNGIADAIR